MDRQGESLDLMAQLDHLLGERGVLVEQPRMTRRQVLAVGGRSFLPSLVPVGLARLGDAEIARLRVGDDLARIVRGFQSFSVATWAIIRRQRVTVSSSSGVRPSSSACLRETPRTGTGT